ncbi:hypothetical protein [Dokdonia sinensis]|nr:hypothetical protein [Dokdonia sinensis]
MEERFYHLATLSFRHEYFEDGLFRPLSIKPTLATLAMLGNLGIVVKPISGGAHLLISEHHFSSAQVAEEPLRFYLDSSDPYFINYTELQNFQPATALLYYNNLNAINTSDSPKYLLKNETFLGTSEILRVEQGVVSLVSFQEGITYRFSIGNDETIPWNFIEQRDNMVNAFKFYDVPEGIIWVYKDDVLFDMFYYQPNGVWNKPLGIIELTPAIMLQQYVTHNTAIINNVEFKARKTHWKYICNHNREPYLKNLVIKQDTIEDNFKMSVAGDTMIFISKLPIALSESPKNAYQLIQKSIVENEGDKTIIATLPIASPNQLYPPEDNSYEAYFSHIYLHL